MQLGPTGSRNLRFQFPNPAIRSEGHARWCHRLDNGNTARAGAGQKCDSTVIVTSRTSSSTTFDKVKCSAVDCKKLHRRSPHK